MVTDPPLGRMLAGANRHDSPLLAPPLDRLDDLGPLPDDITVHLDAGYDSDKTRGPPPPPPVTDHHPRQLQAAREKRSAGAGSDGAFTGHRAYSFRELRSGP